MDLDRTFFPIDGKKTANADEIEAWGRLYGTQTWKELLNSQRVVVLAEASSGKTEEFRNQVARINQTNGFAFFTAIEELARKKFTTLIGHAERPRFEEWKARAVPAWFFLDSLDEAKLNHFSLETALNELTEAIGDALDRAYLVVSSRGTDWDGEEDLQRILQFMPPAASPAPEELDEDQALTSALVRENRQEKKKPSADRPAIVVVAMARLSKAQRATYLRARKLTDIPKFELALFRQGLTPMAERPGDLALMVGYWKKHGRFGSLKEMTEFSVKVRLSERDSRPDSAHLTPNKARRGAERLAAALTLGRRLTLLAGRIEDAGDDAIEPAAVLPDWTAQERKALLRRGVFAPASYGHVRFHHRSVVEYLTACWFERLLKGPHEPNLKLLDIFGSTAFGVSTIPPSYRPAAAWLAHSFPMLRRYAIENEPLTLLSFGDPGSFSLAVREAVLTELAVKGRDGDVGDHLIDAQALWMFADKRLTTALRKAWAVNSEPNFHFELLRLIELGEIGGCEDLVSREALDHNAVSHNRILAARAMHAVGDRRGQRALVKDFLANAAKYSPRLTPELAVSVFPEYLSVPKLIRIVEASPPGERFQVEGFGYSLDKLFASCRTATERKGLLAGLVEIGEAEPLDEFHHTSVRHAELLKRFGPLLSLAIAASDADGISEPLVKLLAIGGRSDFEEDRDSASRVMDLVNARPALKRLLFWQDVRVSFKYREEDRAQPRVWWLITHGRRLWSLDLSDLSWLERDAWQRSDFAERRMAFSALYSIVSARPDSMLNLDQLASKFAKDAALMADLREFRAPRTENEWERRHRIRNAAVEAARAAEFAKNSLEWKAYRAKLQEDTTVLTDAERLKKWPGPSDLYTLTRWLAMKTGTDLRRAPAECAKLGAAFGPAVRDAYAAGMKTMWRVTKPRRPIYTADGRFTEMKTSILSIGGLYLESADANWTSGIGSDEAKCAARHAIFADRDVPEWLSQVLLSAPSIISPLIMSELRAEWHKPHSVPTTYLSRCEHSLQLTDELKAGLWRLVIGEEVADPARVTGVTRIIRRLKLDDRKVKRLTTLVCSRIGQERSTDAWEWSAAYLALLFELDVEKAVDVLREILDKLPPELRKERTEGLFASFFGMASGKVAGLETSKPATLAKLLRLAYRSVSPVHDRTHEGIYSSDTRDEAQEGRGRILNALYRNESEDACRLISELASDPAIGGRGLRFRQLARGMAERASEKPAWTEADVVAFEEALQGPVRTGEELLNLACELIDHINSDIRFGDFSIQPLLESAADEFAVQNWLAYEYNRSANGRFTTAREKQVKSDKRPDIALTAAVSGREVAIEIKHGEMNWTLRDLREALSSQLAEDYLLPLSRRHGLFVITNHRLTRFWKSEDKSQRLRFDEVLGILKADALALTSNSAGFIQVEVRGIDAGSVRRKGDARHSDRRRKGKRASAAKRGATQS